MDSFVLCILSTASLLYFPSGSIFNQSEYYIFQASIYSLISIALVRFNLIKGTLTEKLKHFSFCLIVTVLTSLVYHVIAVLFGAYVIENALKTFAASFYVATLSCFSITSCLNSSLVDFLDYISNPTKKRDVKKCVEDPIILMHLPLLGAWLSAIVIPLDWDRPWQAWPIPPIFGAYIGHIMSLFLCQTQIFRPKASKEKIQ